MREIMSRKLFFASISVGIPTVNDVRHQHYCSLDTTTLPTSHTGYSRCISGNLKRSTFNISFSVPWHFYCGKMLHLEGFPNRIQTSKDHWRHQNRNFQIQKHIDIPSLDSIIGQMHHMSYEVVLFLPLEKI